MISQFMLLGGKKTEEPTNCIKFYAESGNVRVSLPSFYRGFNGTLEASTNGRTWTSLSVGSSVYGQRVYVRGTGNTRICTSGSSTKWTLTGTRVHCDGNIENLLDYQTVSLGQHPQMINNAFSSMFYGQSDLVSAPDLCSVTLSERCYDNMFRGTSIATAPSLPAMTLQKECYYAMFYDCRSLTTAPSLPATTLANMCYSTMFYGCSALINVPQTLPAQTLYLMSYYMMFSGCTSLQRSPSISATSIVDGDSCSGMFMNCTSLKTIPYLRTTYLNGRRSYAYMFKGCSSLEFSESQSSYYQNAYRIPVSGTGTDPTSDNTEGMFTGTGGSYTGNPVINTTYYTSASIV